MGLQFLALLRGPKGDPGDGGGGGGSAAPTGAIIGHGTDTAPDGWLACDGAAVSRATYVDLFNAIGTIYGTGDGSTTFNVPDLRGRTPAGLDPTGAAGRLTSVGSGIDGAVIGANGGNEINTLTNDKIPAHEHSLNNHWHDLPTLATQNLGSDGGSQPVVTGHMTGSWDGLVQTNTPAPVSTTGGAGGDGFHQNVQPTLIVLFIIKT